MESCSASAQQHCGSTRKATHSIYTVYSPTTQSITIIAYIRFGLTGLLSHDFLLHIKIAWNLVNSSARNSSRDIIKRTTCCGNSVKLPRFSTSLPCSSTNSSTLWTRFFVHLNWMYFSADANRAQTVSTLMQLCTNPVHEVRSSSRL